MTKSPQSHAICWFIIAVYSIPYFVLRENIHIPIHDILDDFNFIAYQILKLEPEYLFAPGGTIIPSYLGGQIRDVYPSEFNLYTLLNVFAPLEVAYAVNDILTRAVAYLGMFLLIKKINNDTIEAGSIPHFVACLFALLPFWPSWGLAVSGSPLVIWAFLNLTGKRNTLISFIILATYPFYSSFIYGGMFTILAGGVLLIRSFILANKSSLYLLLGILLITSISVLVNYRLFRLEFLTGFESHRTVWPSSETNFLNSLRKMIKYLALGQYHAASLHFPIISVTGFLFALFYFKKGIPKKIYYVMFSIILTAFVAGFYRWVPFEQLKVNYLPFLLSLQLDRVYYLIPFLVYLLFAQNLIFLKKEGNFAKNLAYCLIGLQLLLVFSHHPEILAYRNSSTECAGTNKCNNVPSLKQFVARDIFDEIKQDIDLPTNSYRVASFGLHPSISAMNGLQTIDGYMVIYDLKYKNKFENIIKKELSKSPELNKYFHEWGSRAYIFASELGNTWNVYSKNDTIEVKNLELDMVAFRKLGGQFLISAIPIKGKIENLKLIKHYSNLNSFWKLYLYEYMGTNF